jgi:hypothetical protein
MMEREDQAAEEEEESKPLNPVLSQIEKLK